jgi:hypothetical protein
VSVCVTLASRPRWEVRESNASCAVRTSQTAGLACSRACRKARNCADLQVSETVVGGTGHGDGVAS